MAGFESFDGGDEEVQVLPFSDRNEVHRFLTQFGTDMEDVAASLGTETANDLRELGPRLAVAMAANGDIPREQIPLIIETLRQEVDTGLLSADAAQEWLMEAEADMRTGQLIGAIPQDEELEDELFPPEAPMDIDAMVEAQICAIHEQAGFLGLSDEEIAAAEAEVLEDAEQMRREEEEDGDEMLRRAA